jgi:hypothetical protein
MPEGVVRGDGPFVEADHDTLSFEFISLEDK